ncbi:aldehyde dehydrogenase [Pseudomonas sp. ATCC 13867]|uniref:aldehyde dehydrogenase family protein n=1 Tax=Pseudomonas sp. ATCC 13867 TaxID=1294143 RepID=UPI0002C4E23D|nr:aldehyde dehydrogenase family protein [Pseudomonas sp. ATCC 13867]AGI23158.1 aldehyde dehydrogenase [Pseudomonas sp. ATCC 13867]
MAEQKQETKVALNWIDGQWCDGERHGDSINPATGEIIGRYAQAGVAEAQRAIAAARRAFREENWKQDRLLRARVLNRMADRFEASGEALARLITTENGKTLEQARFEIGIVPLTLRFNAALALTDHGHAAQVEPGQLSMVLREPVGVAGIIAPWNSPGALMVRSLAPALAAGATAVISLPRQTAQVNALMAGIIAGTEGLPRGVVNLFTGGHEAGNVLVESPDVPSISFTGSTRTGRAISATASANLKRLGLELGGKTPVILFDDADLNAALPKVVEALTVFSGQFCMTGSRLLVQRGIAERVRDELSRRLEAVKVGPGLEPGVEMGPLIDRSNVERVNGMVTDAIAAGAKVLVRGGPVSEGDLARGAFYRPTLLEVTDSSLDIVQKEVFGPVLTLQLFDTEQQAVVLANDSEYGLAASIWSRDIDRPLRVAREIEAGTIWVNDWAVLYDQFEEGGFKQSGQGRMRGYAVIDDFVEFKHIALRPGVVET